MSPTQADECCDRAKRLLRAHQGMGTRSPAPDAPTADCLSQAMLCRLAMVAETAKALECMEHCTKDGLEKARKPLTSAVEAFKKWEASLVELRAERERAGGSGKGGTRVRDVEGRSGMGKAGTGPKLLCLRYPELFLTQIQSLELSNLLFDLNKFL